MSEIFDQLLKILFESNLRVRADWAVHSDEHLRQYRFFMSFIAGYQGKKNGNSSHKCSELERTLRNFRIIKNDGLDSYDNSVIETRFGCLLRKYKKNYPVQSNPYVDENGNTLLVLGFLSSLVQPSSAEQLRQCEGEFVAIFSEASGKLHIVNDRFGSRPFYIYQDVRSVYFSSNLAFLLDMIGGSHAPDILGWLHTFSYGHTLGTGTTFKGISRLHPASHTMISADGILEEKPYWKLEYSTSNNLEPISYSKEVFEAFKAGARLRSGLVGKGVVALSGGLDSRLVAAALPENAEFSGFTFINSSQDDSSADAEIAPLVCEVLGLRHRLEPIPSQEYSTVAEDVIRLTGGMRPLHHSATVMPYIREMKRCDVKFLLGGGPGDVSAGSKIPSVEYLDPRRTDEGVRNFCKMLAGGAEQLAGLFQKKVIKEYQHQVYRSLLNSFDEIAGPTAAHRVTAWQLLNRWPAFTFTSVMHNHPDVAEAFCHLDYKYSDLMLKLPAEWLYQRNFYSFMIYTCVPALRDIPYANTGRVLSGELQRFNYERDFKTRATLVAGQTARKLIPRKLKRLLRPIAKGTPSLQYRLYTEDTRLLSEIKECISSFRSLREILDSAKCLSFVDKFRSDNVTNLSYDRQTELVGSLATMCLTFKSLMTH